MSDWKQGLFGYGDDSPWASEDVWRDPLTPTDSVVPSSSEYVSPTAPPVPVSTWVWLAAGGVLLVGATVLLNRGKRRRKR